MGWKTEEERRAYVREYEKRPYVKEKRRKYMVKYIAENREKIKARNHASYRRRFVANREALNSASRQWAASDEGLAYRKRFYEGWRSELIEAYGGACACCGEETRGFLTIDHIEPVRSSKRNQLHPSKANGYKLYKWLKENGWPKEGHRLLCYNCNIGRKTSPCPHEVERSRAALKVVFE